MLRAEGVPIKCIENCGLEAKAPFHPNTLSPAHTKNRSIHRKIDNCVIQLKLKAFTEKRVVHCLNGQALNRTSDPPVRHRLTGVSINIRAPFTGGSTAVV